MKNLLNVNGAQMLSKDELLSISGGKDPNWCQFRPNGTPCGGPGAICCGGTCTQTFGGNGCP